MKKQQVGLVIGLAKKNASRSKYRSFLLIFGVILTIALETGIVISVDTLYDDFIFNNRNQNFTDISVFPKKWLDISPLQSIAETIRYIKGVRKASPVYSIVANKFLPEEIPDTNILIYGIDPETHPDISILNVTKGENTIVSNKIVVSQNLLQQSGFQVGESFDIPESELNLKSRTLTIIGSIGDPTFFGNNIGYLFILININTLLDLIQENDKPNLLRAKIDVSVDNLLDIKEVNERIKDKLSIDFYVWNEKDISDIEAEGIRIYQIAMNLVILASFLVEFLFITNILAIVIKDRSKEFGIFRAVGGSNSQLIVMITSEILIYSIIGSIIGLIIGLGLATVLVGLMQSFYSSLNLKTLSLNPLSLLATLSSGIIVTIISGLYPIFIALTQPVVQNIHSNMRNKRSSIRFLSKWKYTIISGTLIILAGFILQFFVGPTRFLDFKILSIQFFVLLFIFIGTVFVEIGFLIFLPKIATKLLTPFVGIIIQTISIRNIAREFQKSLFTIMTAALALTFIIVVGIVSSAIISGVPVFIQDQWGRIDLVAEARDNQLPDINFTQILEQNESILRSSFIQRERTEIQGVYSYVYGVDPSRYSYFAEDVIESVAGYSAFKDIYPNQTKGSIAVDTTYGLVSELLFQKLYSSIGSNISVKIADNSTLLVTIAAVIKSNVFLGNGEYLYISSNRFNECFNSTLAKYFLCDVEGDISRVRTLFELNYPQFKEVLAIDFFAKAIERSLLFQSVIFQILFLESFILAAIAQFVCILVSTLHMEREIGIMRAMGLTIREVFGIFISESIILGVTALLIGVLDGLLGSILLAWYISHFIQIEVVFPFDKVLIWICFSFTVTLASTILPSYRSGKKNIAGVIIGRPLRKQYVEIPPFHQQFSPFWQAVGTSEKMILLHVKSSQNPEISNQKSNAVTNHPSASFIDFLKSRVFRIMAVFMVLLTIISLDHVIFKNILARGLIFFDFIWRTFVLFLPIKSVFNNFYPEIFLLINPFVFLLGLGIISPVTYYLVYDSPSIKKILVLFVESLFGGIIGILICILLPFLLFIFLIVLISPITFLLLHVSYFNFSGLFVLSITITLVVIILELLFFQKLWSFLIFNGLSQNLNIEQKIIWINLIGSRGRITFIGIMIFHFVTQSVLFLLYYFRSEISFYGSFLIFGPDNPFSLLLSDAMVILITTSLETGFFLVLIIYQIIQFQKKSHKLLDSTSYKTYAKRTLPSVHEYLTE